MVCYMVVSPNPYNGGWTVFNGKRGFYVKFGDGEFRPSYGTHNPDHIGIENAKHTDDAIYMPNVTGMGVRKGMKVRLGKALEWEFMQCWSAAHSETEWHFFPEDNSLNLEKLREYLTEALDLFPDIVVLDNMNMTMADATERFATVMETLEEHENTPRWRS